MDKNRQILKKTLKYMKEYPPEERVWKGIEKKLNSRINVNSIGPLTGFDPPESVWNTISEELSLRELTGKLNAFEPPETNWLNIEKNLAKNSAKHTGSTIGMWVRWSIAAAAMIAGVLFVYFSQRTSGTGFTYSVERVDQENTQQWNSDDKMIAQTLAIICREKPESCQTSEFKKIEKELDFLNQSKEYIISQMNPYDTNTDLTLMLTKIELEQNDLINQMVAMVN